MIHLRLVLRDHCRKVHLNADPQHEHLPPQRYILAAVVFNLLEENSTSVLSFEDVIDCVKSASSDNILCRFLVDDDVDRTALMDLCQLLKQFSQFRIYKNFIIFNLHQLLSNISTVIDDLFHHTWHYQSR